MRDLLSPRSRPTDRYSRRYAYVVFLLAALAMLVAPAAASAAGFKEKFASARWSTPFQCPDGSTAADGRVIVERDLFIEDGTEPDPNPPLEGRVHGSVSGRHLQLGFRAGDADDVPQSPEEGEDRRHVLRRAG